MVNGTVTTFFWIGIIYVDEKLLLTLSAETVFSNYQKMFGLDIEDSDHKNAINFLILCLKFYIHRCKFQNVCPSFQAYKTLVKI